MTEQTTNLTVAQLAEAIAALEPRAEGLKKADLVALYDGLTAKESEQKSKAKKAPTDEPAQPEPTTLVEALTGKAAILIKVCQNSTIRSLRSADGATGRCLAWRVRDECAPLRSPTTRSF